MFRARTIDIIKSDLEALKQEGIEGLVFDIDGTLISLFDVASDISPQVNDFIKTARKLGFEIFIISNSTDLGKIKSVIEVLKIDEKRIIARGNDKRWKPWRMEEALEELELLPEETIMIGNNPYNDGIGAWLAGMRFCWVLRP